MRRERADGLAVLLKVSALEVVPFPLLLSSLAKIWQIPKSKSRTIVPSPIYNCQVKILNVSAK